MSIYDTYFIKSDNKNALEYLAVTNAIIALEAKISNITKVLHFLWQTKTTREIRYEWLDYLQKTHNIVIDRNADFTEEVQRVLSVDIGILNNDLSFEKIRLEELKQGVEQQIFDFYDSLQGIGDAHGRTLDEKLSLPMYVAESKSALRKMDAAKKRQTKQKVNG